MQALRVLAPGDFEITEMPTPEPRRDEVLVEVGAAGICGSDLHILDGDFPPTPFPITTGHEGSGTVVAVGSAVSSLRMGDRVAINPSLSCGLCGYCRAHRENLCDGWASIGGTRDGSFAEFVAVPATNAFRIPDSMSFENAAMAEPVACAIHAMDRLVLRPGESVLVLGAGTGGLILAQLARHAGAAGVSIANRGRERLEVAERLGFTSIGTSIDDLPAASPIGFDVVIDATGVPSMVEAGVSRVRKGGRMLIYGMAPPDGKIVLKPRHLLDNEITILTSLAILASYERAVAMLEHGAVDAASMVTHRYPLERFDDAVSTLREGEGTKHQIVPSMGRL